MGRGTDCFMLGLETSLLSTGMAWEMKGSPDASLDQFPKKVTVHYNSIAILFKSKESTGGMHDWLSW